MTSRKRLERRGAAAAGAVVGAAAGMAAAIFIPVPPEYEKLFFYACFGACSLFFSILFMRLNKTL